uniref:Uncharacterized protein n=1 Tax=Glossina palpalis gambiensis TaxID=67801 RepID=A0A1B0BHI4_9MUSC
MPRHLFKLYTRGYVKSEHSTATYYECTGLNCGIDKPCRDKQLYTSSIKAFTIENFASDYLAGILNPYAIDQNDTNLSRNYLIIIEPKSKNPTAFGNKANTDGLASSEVEKLTHQQVSERLLSDGQAYINIGRYRVFNKSNSLTQSTGAV